MDRKGYNSRSDGCVSGFAVLAVVIPSTGVVTRYTRSGFNTSTGLIKDFKDFFED
jgi:hypothetical protein